MMSGAQTHLYDGLSDHEIRGNHFRQHQIELMA
jgi:hypothetical protein